MRWYQVPEHVSPFGQLMKLGVIPARFQVPDLHPAHHILLEKAKSENDEVLVALGVSNTGPTNHNPLDFKTRAMMLRGHYHDLDVAQIKDRKSDLTWSNNLDELIGTYAKETDQVTLYCGRDGFRFHYKGKYRVVQMDALPEYSGTAIRNQVRLKPVDSVDFRLGVIYGVGSKYPETFSTVDIAVVRDGGVLMGRRPGETHLRFPGGFVDFEDKSRRITCKRELEEETSLIVKDVRDLNFIESFEVDDWRYRNRPDARIMTDLFMIDLNNTLGEPMPDGKEFEEFIFVSIDGDSLEDIVSEHKPLFMELYRFMNGYAHGVSEGVQTKATIQKASS